MKDFFAAIRCAETMGDSVASLIQLENAFTAAQERLAFQDHPFLKARWSRMQDLKREVGELRGLPPDESNDNLADNLSATLFAFQKSLSRNDVRGLARARTALARIYARSERPGEALRLFVVAGVGSKSSEVHGATQSLLKQSEQKTIGFLRDLCLESGATRGEIVTMAAIIAQLGDFVPDDVVEHTASKFLKLIESRRTSDYVINAVLPALGKLSDRIPEDLWMRIVTSTIGLLDVPIGLRNAIGVATGKLVTTLASNTALRDVLDDEVRQQVIKKLTELTSDEVMGQEALIVLLQIGLAFGVQSDEDTPQNHDDEIDAEVTMEDSVKAIIQDKALVERQIVPLQVYVGAKIGSVPKELSQAVLRYFIRVADEEWEMAETLHFNLSAHPISLSGLKSFVSIVQPGVLPTEELTHFVERLLALAQHPENMISHRGSAFYALGLLAEALHQLQEAHQISDDFLERVANVAHILSQSPKLGIMTQQLHDGATDNLNRFKFNSGEVNHFQSIALRTLGRLMPYVTPATREKSLSLVISSSANGDSEIRDGAAYAFLPSHESLTATQRQLAIAQLYVLLHDQDPDVRSTALFVLAKYDEDLQVPMSTWLLQRVIVLTREPGSAARCNAAHLLRRWFMLPVFTAEREAIRVALQSMVLDASNSVRSTARRQLKILSQKEH